MGDYCRLGSIVESWVYGSGKNTILALTELAEWWEETGKQTVVNPEH